MAGLAWHLPLVDEADRGSEERKRETGRGRQGEAVRQGEAAKLVSKRAIWLTVPTFTEPSLFLHWSSINPLHDIS